MDNQYNFIDFLQRLLNCMELATRSGNWPLGQETTGLGFPNHSWSDDRWIFIIERVLRNPFFRARSHPSQELEADL